MDTKVQELMIQRKLENIYQAADQSLSGLLDTRNLYIALYDELSNTLSFPLAYRDGKAVSEQDKAPGDVWGPRLHQPEVGGLTDWVIRHRRSLLIPAAFSTWVRDQEDVFAWDEQSGMPTRCWLGVPILLEDEILGVIGLQNFERERVFSRDDQALLETIAAQAAVAIWNVRLLEERISAEKELAEAIAEKERSDERARRLDALQEITQLISQTTKDPDDVLRYIAEAANDITQSDLTSVFRYMSDMSTFTGGVRAERNENGVNEYRVLTDDDLPDLDGVVADAARNAKKIVYLIDTNTLPLWAAEKGIKTFTAWPLKITDISGIEKVVGILVVNYIEPHDADEEEEGFLEHLTSLAGIAIEYIEDKQGRYANEQLAALGSATAALQHRLSNTINVTLPAVMRLRLRAGDDAETKRILDVIERNTIFANDVVRRMRSPLRQEEFAQSDLSGLIREAIRACQTTYGDKVIWLQRHAAQAQSPDTANVTISTQMDRLPSSYARSASLTEVFSVLIENAVKAVLDTQPDKTGTGTVSIVAQVVERPNINNADVERREIEIRVEDTGKGIDPVVRERLFKQPVPRKEFGEGAGLGLWLSYIIIRSHRGRITFASKVGQGATFTVRLPILTHPPVTTDVPTASPEMDAE